MDRLFGAAHAFDDSATVLLVGVVGGVLALAPLLILFVDRVRGLDEKRSMELWVRWRSWLILVALIAVPVLLGAAWTILGVTVLSLLCYREYSRATGLFREKFASLLVVIGILAVNFAALDHWYNLFEALFPLTVAALAGFTVVQDRPEGYIQRVALSVFGFALFGSALGHLSYMANDVHYRPILLLVLVAVELNDVAAFVSGRLLGRRKLCPHTSPNKTIAGAVGAVVATTLFVTLLGQWVFAGRLDPLRLVILGLIISVVGQLGDLVLSSIKRDLGIKDMGTTIPGHGGLLDRFDSLILVGPAVFHYVGYFIGFGLDQPICIFSGARS
ncbi:phosphatidate cytidylyltransferase [Planctomycetaceae bacterium SCGC AG-212-F19]|nr:phosphatidate cytidylyltransferase [Planctomycetaceae bacterium SCGC AG-212-F19]